jgi:hypothetical protein
MIKISTYLLSFLSLTIFFSCGDGHSDHNASKKKETPAALQDSKSEISYGRSKYDLMEDLYEELVEKSPELKKLEEDLEAFKSKSDEITYKFNKYEDKSNSYYSSADYKITKIKDGLLRKKMAALISESKNKYSKNTAELKSLLKLISQNNTTLDDHHSVLKIIVTLPVIEKYQSESLPDKGEFKKLIREQERLIGQEDSLSSK